MDTSKPVTVHGENAFVVVSIALVALREAEKAASLGYNVEYRHLAARFDTLHGMAVALFGRAYWDAACTEWHARNGEG